MKILDIALKDLTRSLRSAFAIGMMVVAPLMLTGLIYFAFSGMSGGEPQMPRVAVGVVNDDTLPVDAPLEAALGVNIRSMFFDESVASWITAADYPDAAAARQAVDRQEIGVAVIIPAGLTAAILEGSTDVEVLIVSDPTLTIGPQVVQNMVASLLDGVAGGGVAIQTLLERQQANQITPDPAQISTWVSEYSTWYAEFQRNLFHHPAAAAMVLVAPTAGVVETVDPFQKTMALTMTGQMIFFAFFTGANSMMTILQEDEEGTLARLFTTPTDRTVILAGKFLAVLLMVILQGLVLMLAGRLAFGVEWGNPLTAGLALTGQVIAATGLGVFLISFVKNTRQGGPVLGGGLTALGMLGGLFTANIPGGMPEAFKALANFTPQGWVLKGWEIALAGQPVSAMLVPVAIMLGMGIAMFAVGAGLFRRRFA